MTFSNAIKLRLGLVVMAGSALIGVEPAPAQSPAAYQEDPATALTRHLKSLSDNPQSLYALMGAGEAALKLGDPQAAVTFFARAEEVAPRDGRIKAGMGSAFVQMEQAQSALRFFAEAASLGISEAELAGDRGLAYDLLGNNQQAQRDYRLALGRKKDPEIERRLALSLAIAGDKAGAIRVLGDQLMRQERAAWRTRAFVLALTGDAAGATEAARAVMPAQAAAMQPFLTRLASLDAPSRAMAVHFGHFPGEGRPVQIAQAPNFSGPPAATVQPGRPDAGQPALGTRTALSSSTTRPLMSEPAESPDRRRPGATETAAVSPPAQTVPAPAETQRPAPQPERPVQVATATPAPTAPAATWVPAPRAPEPRPEPPAATSQAATGGTPSLTQAQPSALPPAANAPPTYAPPTYTPPTLEPFGPPAFDASPRITTPAPAPSPSSGNGASGIQTVALPESTPVATPQPASETPPPAEAPVQEAVATPTPAARKPLDFAEVAAAVRALPDAARPLRTAEARPAPAKAAEAAPAKPAEKQDEAAPKPAKGDTSSRHWVQIASAPDSLVSGEYRRLRRKHSALLADKEGYSTPMGKSNRVLVGPFASVSAAKDFVGELKKNSLTAIAWTSAAGQEIEKLPAK
jgi:Flp pilus assembly protein TadD